MSSHLTSLSIHVTCLQSVSVCVFFPSMSVTHTEVQQVSVTQDIALCIYTFCNNSICAIFHLQNCSNPNKKKNIFLTFFSHPSTLQIAHLHQVAYFPDLTSDGCCWPPPWWSRLVRSQRFWASNFQWAPGGQRTGGSCFAVKFLDFCWGK